MKMKAARIGFLLMMVGLLVFELGFVLSDATNACCPCICLGPVQTAGGSGSGASCGEAVANAYLNARANAAAVCTTCQVVENPIVACYLPSGGSQYGGSASVSFKCRECDIFGPLTPIP